MCRLTALSGNSGPSSFHRGVEKQLIPNQKLKLKKETLDCDFQARQQVSSYEKTWVKNREDSVLKKTSWRLWTIRSQSQGTERIVITTRNPQKRNSFACDFDEKKKPAFIDKDDFECQDKSKVIAYSSIFGQPRFRCEEKINDFICQLISTKLGIRQRPGSKLPNVQLWRIRSKKMEMIHYIYH